MQALLISTYDLGRPPFGLASPAAWLAESGFSVRCNDLSVQPLDEAAVRSADLIGFYLPMHTATRLAARVLPRVRALNPRAHLCCYGLYAPLNEALLRSLGVATILGGEFEAGLVSVARRVAAGRGAEPQEEPRLALERLSFLPPRRDLLPSIERYAHVHWPDGTVRLAGYTEASRGCKHSCRHCPIVPVYAGRFRVIPRDVVLEDVRRQVAAGAKHITFGDPDFFNGIGHALPIVRALNAEHPGVTYDVTIKVEHLLRHARHLPELAGTGCAFVTSAVEAVDDRILERLDKQHTRADFERVVEACRAAKLVLNPTFVAFTPWTTLEGYRDVLDTIERLDLVEQVAPVQLAIRLLIPNGSKLLELAEVRNRVGAYDGEALVYPWRHFDSRVDDLQREAEALIAMAVREGAGRAATFERICALASSTIGRRDPKRTRPVGYRRPPVPYLSEPWYC